jgi:hypothetical protein
MLKYHQPMREEMGRAMKRVPKQASANERREGRGLNGNAQVPYPMGGAMEGVAKQVTANGRREGRA